MDLHPPRRRHHAQDASPEPTERLVDPGKGDRLGVEDQLRQPLAQHLPVPEQTREQRHKRLDVEQSLVHVEDDNPASVGACLLGHRSGLISW